ncbi:MAG TPA: hypothetical protein VFX51_13125 [Solirubrobacteraceae bacterium]|nr:hypothetical protein [Solirubrobacteraceae bacterium]
MAAFTVYWRRDYWKSLPREDPGPRLTVLFGGPHQSQPSFLRAGVEVGDRLFPITAYRRRVYVLASMLVSEIVEVDSGTDPELRGLLRRYAEWSFLAETCTTEVVIGTQGTPIRRDRVVPGHVLRSWRYLNRRGERGLRFLEGDEMARADSFWGIYRLSDDTAAALATMTGEGLAIVP